jgi:homoserine kinase
MSRGHSAGEPAEDGDARVTGNWLAELDGRTVTVEVPASTANLGAGYDCLALALDLPNRISVEVGGWNATDHDLVVEGEGAGELTAGADNRFIRGLEAALVAARGDLPDGTRWRIEMRNEIPLARGLGSSAAATVGGLLAGNTLVGDTLPIPELLRLATAIEGHPDNVAAALLGGFVVSADLGELVEAVRFDSPRDLRAVVYVPEIRLATEEMRRALPDTVPRADAVANLGRVALGVAGLARGRADVLRWLTVDRLHEPYRAAVFPQLPRFVDAAREAGAVGACLSGAGSAIVAFSSSLAGIARIEAALRAAGADTDLPGQVLVVSPRNAGAAVIGRA